MRWTDSRQFSYAFSSSFEMIYKSEDFAHKAIFASELAVFLAYWVECP